MVDDSAARIAEGMRALKPLLGRFKGSGRGDYPTIEAFRYTEDTCFRCNDVEPLVVYEQRTWMASDGEDDGEPLHWEVGFVRPVDRRTIEMSSSQNGVRVEVLSGPLEFTDSGFRWVMDSLLIGHDPRPVRTRRVVTLEKDTLSYTVEMQTTRNPVLQQHLEAVLRRVD